MCFHCVYSQTIWGWQPPSWRCDPITTSTFRNLSWAITMQPHAPWISPGYRFRLHKIEALMIHYRKTIQNWCFKNSKILRSYACILASKKLKSFPRHFIFWQRLMFNQISSGKWTYCLGGFVYMQVTDANEFGVYSTSLFVLWICEMKI